MRILAGDQDRFCGRFGTVCVMKEQQQRTSDDVQDSTTEPETAGSTRASDIRDEIDDLLDEIDGLLEENAEEFVRNYVQKGGQ